MSWPQKSIVFTYVFIFSGIPLIFLPYTSELFEFNKIVAVYLSTIFVIFFWLARCFSEKRFIFQKTILDLPLLLFLGIQLLSLAFSIDPRTSFLGYYSRFNGGFMSFLSYSILYWAAVSNLNQKSVHTILKWSLISSAIVASWGVAEHFGADASMWVQDVRNRVFSTLGQPNWLAAYLVALIFLPLSNLLTTHNSKPSTKRDFTFWYHLLLTILLFVTLLYTKSRSGLLAFGVSSGVFWIFNLYKTKAQIIKPVLIFFLIVLTLSLTISNPLRDLIFSRLAINPQSPTTDNPQPSGTSLETGGTESGLIRQIVWEGAIDIWRSSSKYFWLGSGPETFAMAYYEHRPQSHNATSEWELLYNKAHNEFINYLSTTGLLGLLSYLTLLIFMSYIFIIQIKSSPDSKLLTLSLFSGWISLSITNFWGFSVVVSQLFLFIFPAFVVSLKTPLSPPKSSTNLNFLSLMFLLTALTAGLYVIGRYWIADVHYASGQKSMRAFGMSQDPQYILNAYESLTQAYKLNNQDPTIISEMGNASAYMSLLFSENDATSSAEFAKISQVAINRAITISPHHPNYYKSAARSLIILGTMDSRYFEIADSILAKAETISPTDPRLPYNRGIIAKYLSHKSDAEKYFNEALVLKPDFTDALNQLSALEGTPSASPSN